MTSTRPPHCADPQPTAGVAPPGPTRTPSTNLDTAHVAGAQPWPDDPYTAGADEDLLDDLLPWLTSHRTDPAATAWAIYAYRATFHLFEPGDARRQAAAAVLARLLHDHPGGSAAPAWREPDATVSQPTALTEARFAVVRALHERGLCDPALHEARAALHMAGRVRGGSGIAGVYLLSTVRVLDLCGRIDDARALLDAQRWFAGRSLPPPVIARLAQTLLGNINAIVSHRRVCTWNRDPAGWRRRNGYGEVQQMFLDRLDAQSSQLVWPPTRARPNRPRRFPDGAGLSQVPARASPGPQQRASPPGPATTTRPPA